MPRSDPKLSIYIGYDSKEAVAFHVLSASILRRASIPVSIVPLTRQSLERIYTRERGPTEATEFSLTRFLVPYLSDYRGMSVFMDCDMLMRVDIIELWLELLAQPGQAVWCCQHDYVPKSLVKFDGHEQTTYPRKNWSSFMVFDNAKCEALTPAYVNSATGLQLHRFHWLDESKDGIGSLPLSWNWLIGEYEPNENAKVLHYTNGGPWFTDYATGDHTAEWWEEYRAMTAQIVGAVSA